MPAETLSDQTTSRHWEEAKESAQSALEARLALWDGIHARLNS